MSDIRPFKGVRPRPEYVAQVASPPYDVLNSEEAAAMAEGNPISWLHVSKSEIDLPPEVDHYSPLVYEKAAENFAKLIDKGVFIQDDRDCFYVYQLIMNGHRQRGIMVGASVDEYEKNIIKKHELTRRDKEDDRTNHLKALMANAGPALFTYRHKPEITNFVNNLCETRKPDYDFTAPDGIRHTVWVVGEPTEVKLIQDEFKKIDCMYVADGHHRTASAFRMRNLMRDANPNHTGNEPYNYFMTVVFPDDELKIMGYHRAVKDLNGNTPEQFLAKVAEKFEIKPAANPEPKGALHFTMYLDEKWFELVARPGTYDAADPVKSLDVAILQQNLLDPILGIKDPRTDKRVDFIGGIRGTGELERRCKLDMRVAFACAPVSVEQLIAVADAGSIMPPKSTWFEPKLRSGVIIRSLKEEPIAPAK